MDTDALDVRTPVLPDFRAIAEQLAQGTVVNHGGGSDTLPRAISRLETELRAMYERGRAAATR